MSLQLKNAAHKRPLVLYFQVHQPKRLRNFRFFDIGSGHSSLHDELDKQIVQRVAQECYLPANNLLLKLIRQHPKIKITFSLSGVIIDQLEEYAPEVLDSFRALAATGSVEFLAETYYHSLASIISGKEFEVQIVKHVEKLQEHFNVKPTVFRNTELIYNNDIGRRISRLGFQGIIADGVDSILGDSSPNHVFRHAEIPELKLLLRNYRLSDDIAFRFLEGGKALTAEKYISKFAGLPATEHVLTLALDYETFGEHQKKETGIFKFLEEVLVRLARSNSVGMATASEAIERTTVYRSLSVPNFISWADNERDLSAWLGNEMQRDAFDSLVALEYDIKNLNNEELTEQWRTLQTSDHFYYMSTKKGSDGNIHRYFSPYPSPYEAFINYMNVLTDFSLRLKVLKSTKLEEIGTYKATVNQWPQSMGLRMTMLSK